MKTSTGIYAALGIFAAVVLAVTVALGFLGQRAGISEGKTSLGKPLSKEQQTARRRGAITAVGAVTAM